MSASASAIREALNVSIHALRDKKQSLVDERKKLQSRLVEQQNIRDQIDQIVDRLVALNDEIDRIVVQLEGLTP